MRPLLTTCLFVAATVGLLSAGVTGQQPPEKKQKSAQPKADPAANKPDEATRQAIAEKTKQLRDAVERLRQAGEKSDHLAEVEIYLKAAENIVRFDEWLHANSVKWTLATLDEGLERAKQHGAPWREVRGKWVVRAYRSMVDGSIQPYAVLLPADFAKDPKKRWRLDVVLHGRDAALTEAKFIATHGPMTKAPAKNPDYVQLEVYGRGNNAYRWAGETDVFSAMSAFQYWASVRKPAVAGKVDFEKPLWEWIDPNRVVLRGFSMGGAGTWHIGLHHPGRFCVIGPGAGFTTTHGYIGNLPKELPDYQEKCLHIYDAIDYAENAFNVPVVAYSGANDPQKKAADNIENILKGFREPLRFTHLVAPGLEHQMPAEWQAKAEAEYRKYADKGRDPNPERIRFVTYTPRYGGCGWLWVRALERTYEKATVDARRDGASITITATNVRWLVLDPEPVNDAQAKLRVTVNGQALEPKPAQSDDFTLVQTEGKWAWVNDPDGLRNPPTWKGGLHGPIDDAFMDQFVVVKPTGPGWNPVTDRHVTAAVEQFAGVWDRYFRGALPVIAAADYEPALMKAFGNLGNLVLFGDPASNPLIARLLPGLPITWTKDKLVVNGVEYDPKTHLPVLIYPDPRRYRYVVINSGHTFKEADLKGTNALLYPRLGDWAVIKPTPTDKDPAAHEVVAAGLFDDNWQFPKK
jgi:hypothetical protein